MVEADRCSSTELNTIGNEEKHAEMNGMVVHLPSLRDRLFFRAGELFIELGRKMTTHSLDHVQLTGKTA